MNYCSLYTGYTTIHGIIFHTCFPRTYSISPVFSSYHTEQADDPAQVMFVMLASGGKGEDGRVKGRIEEEV